jgi:hypothetical protein
MRLGGTGFLAAHRTSNQSTASELSMYRQLPIGPAGSIFRLSVLNARRKKQIKVFRVRPAGNHGHCPRLHVQRRGLRVSALTQHRNSCGQTLGAVMSSLFSMSTALLHSTKSSSSSLTVLSFSLTVVTPSNPTMCRAGGLSWPPIATTA